MFRIDTPNATPDGRFQEADPFAGRPRGTEVSAEWMTAFQEELLYVLAQAGITPSKQSTIQLFQALQILRAAAPGDRQGIRAPGGLMNLPLLQSGHRVVVPLFDFKGLWIGGNSRERPHSGTAAGGSGGAPRGCRVLTGIGVGVGAVDVERLPGVVSPGVGFTFQFAGSATVHTVSSIAGFDHEARVCTINFTPNTTAAAAAGAAVTFIPRVDNGAGYAIGASAVAIDGLIDSSPCRGCTVVFSNHATVYTITNATQFAAPGDCTLTLTPTLTSAVPDNTSLTIVGAPDANQVIPGAYETASRVRERGDLWPYMTCDAHTAHQNLAGGPNNGMYPLCDANSNINAYSRGLLIPRRVAAGAATVELDWVGDITGLTPGAVFLEWVLAPNLNADVGFQFTLPGLAVPFQSSVLNPAQGAGTYPLRVKIVIEFMGKAQSNNNVQWAASCFFHVGPKAGIDQGSQPPVLEQWRGPVIKAPLQDDWNPRYTDTRLPVLWKYEGAGLLHSPGRHNAAVLAAHNGSSLLRITRYTGRIVYGTH